MIMKEWRGDWEEICALDDQMGDADALNSNEESMIEGDYDYVGQVLQEFNKATVIENRETM